MSGFEVILEKVNVLSPTTRDFRFRRLDNMLAEFKPGQFYRFVFEDDSGEFERSYSLCNTDLAFIEGSSLGSSSYLDLVISTVAKGRASSLLFNSRVGLKAKVTGPFGRLLVPEKLPKRLFLVATSVGIAPYLPMLGQLSAALVHGDLAVHFLYGTRDPSEFVYGDLLVAYADSHDGFHLSVCYSRSMPDEPKSYEVEGYVQRTLSQLELNVETDHVLLCGNPMMIDESYDYLKTLGFGVKQVVREKYVFAKQPKAKKKELNDAQKKLLAEKMSKYR